MDRETTAPGLRVELFVTDVRKSATFYADVLGFQVLRAEAGGYTSIGLDGAILGLNALSALPTEHPARPTPGERPGLGVEIVLMVEDVFGAHGRAGSAHAGVSALKRQPWGLTDFRVTDPDGYYIRVTGLSAVE